MKTSTMHVERRACVTKWRAERSYNFHRCHVTNKIIWPGTMAWQKVYYHYYTGKLAFTDWVSDEAYTFELLKNNK